VPFIKTSREHRLLQTHEFRELYDTYYPAVCRQLSYLLQNRAAAEDVAQETFLKLYNTYEWVRLYLRRRISEQVLRNSSSGIGTYLNYSF